MRQAMSAAAAFICAHPGFYLSRTALAAIIFSVPIALGKSAVPPTALLAITLLAAGGIYFTIVQGFLDGTR